MSTFRSCALREQLPFSPTSPLLRSEDLSHHLSLRRALGLTQLRPFHPPALRLPRQALAPLDAPLPERALQTCALWEHSYLFSSSLFHLAALALLRALSHPPNPGRAKTRPLPVRAPSECARCASTEPKQPAPLSSFSFPLTPSLSPQGGGRNNQTGWLDWVLLRAFITPARPKRAETRPFPTERF